MKMRQLLNTPDKWVQNSYARDSQGASVPEGSPSAVSFCLIGAANRCYPGYTEREGVFKRIRAAIGRSVITEFNDSPGRTFSEIQTLLNDLDI